MVTVQLPAGGSSAVEMYTLTSSREDPSTDPTAWTLEASVDGVTWRVVDARRGERFRWRRHTRVFAVREPTPGSRYRLRIDGNAGAVTTRLSEIELLSAEDALKAASARKTDRSSQF